MKFQLIDIKHNGEFNTNQELEFNGVELQCTGNERFVIQDMQKSTVYQYDNNVWHGDNEDLDERYIPCFTESINILEFSNWFSKRSYVFMDWEVFMETLYEFYNQYNNSYSVKRNIVHNTTHPKVQYLLKNSCTNELHLFTDGARSVDKFDTFEFAKFVEWFAQQKFSEMNIDIFFEKYEEYCETLSC